MDFSLFYLFFLLLLVGSKRKEKKRKERTQSTGVMCRLTRQVDVVWSLNSDSSFLLLPFAALLNKQCTATYSRLLTQTRKNIPFFLSLVRRSRLIFCVCGLCTYVCWSLLFKYDDEPRGKEKTCVVPQCLTDVAASR